MITEIGIAAGEIWIFLEEEEKCKVESLFHKISLPQEVIYMALGWLTREGHILMSKNRSGYDLSLRNLKELEEDNLCIQMARPFEKEEI